MILDCHLDTDFAGLRNYEDDQDPVFVRSRTGYVMSLGGCPINWTSKLQTEIALRTTEAEYIALVQSLREFIPLRRAYEEMMTHFNLNKGKATIKFMIFEDNNGAIATDTTPKMSPRTKHIAVKYHFIKLYFRQKKKSDHHPFELLKIGTLEQKADIFTKGLPEEGLLRIRKLLCNY